MDINEAFSSIFCGWIPVAIEDLTRMHFVDVKKKFWIQVAKLVKQLRGFLNLNISWDTKRLRNTENDFLVRDHG